MVRILWKIVSMECVTGYEKTRNKSSDLTFRQVLKSVESKASYEEENVSVWMFSLTFSDVSVAVKAFSFMLLCKIPMIGGNNK